MSSILHSRGLRLRHVQSTCQEVLTWPTDYLFYHASIPPAKVWIWRTGPEGLILGLGFPRTWFSPGNLPLAISAPGVTFDTYYNQRVT